MKKLTNNQSRRGVSLFMVTFSVSVLATLSLSMVMVNTAVTREQQTEKHQIASLLAAESGVSDAVFSMNNGGTGDVGSLANPVETSGAKYWVDATDLGNGLVALTSTGLDGGDGSRVEVTLQKTSSSIWTWGAFGDEELGMDSNAHVDSYDSSLGDYDSQLNGSGNGIYALENGNVGSNGNVTLDGNSEVHGSAIPGPTSTTTIGGENVVLTGSMAPATGVQEFPALVIPSFPMLPAMTVSGSETLASGDYYFDSLTVGANNDLTIYGPATIVVDDFEMKSNANLWVDATDGPVEFYVIDDFILSSNTLVASLTYDPADIEINLESDNIINPTLNVQLSEVALESNAMLYGTLYAPNATVDINSNFELFGAVVARQVHLDSNSRVHFDENLMNSRSSSEVSWQPLCWRTVAYSPTNAVAVTQPGQQY
jgi:hypothetical protein